MMILVRFVGIPLAAVMSTLVQFAVPSVALVRAYDAELLFEAVSDRSDSRARWLLRLGADPEATLPDHASPLEVAAIHGHEDIAQALVDAGADVDRTSGFGWTALHTAASSGSLPVVRVLAHAGANLNAVGECLTPYQVAMRDGHEDVADFLAHAGASTGPPGCMKSDAPPPFRLRRPAP